MPLCRNRRAKNKRFDRHSERQVITYFVWAPVITYAICSGVRKPQWELDNYLVLTASGAIGRNYTGDFSPDDSFATRANNRLAVYDAFTTDLQISVYKRWYLIAFFKARWRNDVANLENGRGLRKAAV